MCLRTDDRHLSPLTQFQFKINSPSHYFDGKLSQTTHSSSLIAPKSTMLFRNVFSAWFALKTRLMLKLHVWDKNKSVDEEEKQITNLGLSYPFIEMMTFKIRLPSVTALRSKENTDDGCEQCKYNTKLWKYDRFFFSLFLFLFYGSEEK